MSQEEKKARASVMLKGKREKDLYDAITKIESKVQGISTPSDLVWGLITDKYLPKKKIARDLCEGIYLPEKGKNLFDSLSSVFEILGRNAEKDRFYKSYGVVWFFLGLIDSDFRLDRNSKDFESYISLRKDVLKKLQENKDYLDERVQYKTVDVTSPKEFVTFLTNTWDLSGKYKSSYDSLRLLCKMVPYKLTNDSAQRSYLVEMIKRISQNWV